MSSAIVIESTEVRERTRLGMWFFLASEIMFFAGFIGAYVVLRTIHPQDFAQLHVELSKWIALANTIVLITSSLTMAFAVAAAHRGDKKTLAIFLGATIALGCTFLVVKGFEYHHHIAEGQVPKTSVMYAAYYTMTGFHGLHVLVGILVLLALLTRTLWGKEREWPALRSLAYVGAGVLMWVFVFGLDLAQDTSLLGVPASWPSFASIQSIWSWIPSLLKFGALSVVWFVAGMVVLFLLVALYHGFFGGSFSVERNVGVEVSGLYWHLVDVIWIFLFPIVYLL